VREHCSRFWDVVRLYDFSFLGAAVDAVKAEAGPPYSKGF
jgi:hypothetical protein